MEMDVPVPKQITVINYLVLVKPTKMLSASSGGR